MKICKKIQKGKLKVGSGSQKLDIIVYLWNETQLKLSVI